MAWSGLDWLFPPRCGGCGKEGSRWCHDCQQKVPALSGNLCEKCGKPQPGRNICEDCRLQPPSFRALRSWAIYEFPVREAILKLKYSRDVGLGDFLAVPLTTLFCSLDWPVDFILPVPIGRKRLRERGYNQVALIARPLSLACGLDYRPGALKRKRETVSQVGLSAVERRENMRDAFFADPRFVRGKIILVVDDVATTGSTLISCSEALLQAGASDVYALTVARVLPHHGLHMI
jgi:competence protein ComFC